MAQIAGVGDGYGAQQTPVVTQSSGIDDTELLSAFEEPAPEPVAEPEPKPAEQPTPVAPSERASVLSSGIELPDVLSQTGQQSPTVAPIPEPEPEPVSQAPAPAVAQTTEVVGSCGECGQRYAVDMPLDIQQAQIDCPKCGNRSTIRR